MSISLYLRNTLLRSTRLPATSRHVTRIPSLSSISQFNSIPSRSLTSSHEEPQTKLSFTPPEPRLSLTFTCTVKDCGTRSTHEFTKRAYTKGIVIVECPGCKNRHLIADHLGWFKESTEEGTLKTVEDLMRAKGEKVQRGTVDYEGTIEYAPEE
ncbi:hypothetical protein ABKN59_003576 [Abortiporus biennis]